MGKILPNVDNRDTAQLCDKAPVTVRHPAGRAYGIRRDAVDNAHASAVALRELVRVSCVYACYVEGGTK